jgi:transposase
MKRRPAVKKVTTSTVQACLGLDLGDEKSHFCLVGCEGEVELRGVVPTERDALAALVRGLPPARVVIEASTHSHWVASLIHSLGAEVYVANPRRLPLITRSSRKNDRNDAEQLARIGRLDVELLSPVRPRSDECMRERARLRSRALLVHSRVRVINSIRSLLKVFGVKPPRCATEQAAKRMAAVVPQELQSIIEPLVLTVQTLDEQIKRFDREIALQAKQHFPATGALQQVHGVGPQVSLSYVTTLVDPRRFKNARTVGAFVGLAPRIRQSGQCDPRLGISKEGDHALRRLLVTAATHILRKSAPDSDLKRYGRRIAASGTPRDKNRARIAVARKLAVLLHRLWLTGEVYQPLRNAKATAAT